MGPASAGRPGSRLEPESVTPDRCHRVLVVSAGMGAGHHAAADELVRRLREQGHVAQRIDVLELGRPGQGRRLRRTYAGLLRWLPWVYDLSMRFWARWPTPLDVFTAHGARSYEEGLLDQVRRFEPDVVVSVFNLASQALGRLRASGRLAVPVATYVPDPGAHPYWVHPAVDLYLATLPITARGLESFGARRTVVVPRLVRPSFLRRPVGRKEARLRLGLPVHADVALVNGGSWAAGRVARTVTCLARSGTVVPVTLCGTDDALRRRLLRRGLGLPLGWVEDVASVMAAADVLVDNAGGLTCCEALSAGLPVVLFRPLPGHGRINAATLEAAGLAAQARSNPELIDLVRRLSREHGTGERRLEPAQLRSDDVVAAVLGLCAPAARARMS